MNILDILDHKMLVPLSTAFIIFMQEKYPFSPPLNDGAIIEGMIDRTTFVVNQDVAGRKVVHFPPIFQEAEMLDCMTCQEEENILKTWEDLGGYSRDRELRSCER